MARKVNVGLIGYAFMGKAHSHGYKDVQIFYPDLGAVPVMKVICGRNREAVKAAASQYGWEEYETSWQRVVERDDIDLVDISTPGHLHKEMAIAAAQAGKDILCEKPLANSLEEAQAMLEAVQKAGVKHMVGFNYRRVPAVALAKRLIQEGKLGQIYHFRAVYLQDWIVDPEFPLVWRLQKDKAGSGPLGDLAAHSVDLARHLIGEITEVVGMAKTFIEERPLLAQAKGAGLSGEAAAGRGKVTVEDAVLFLAKFQNGALGSFEATRFASGRKNYNRFEINGSRGSLVFNLERMNELEFYSREDEGHTQGFRTILVTESGHRYAGAWWPPGHIIGYGETFVNQTYELMQAIAEDRQPSPDFSDGVRCQAVLEAVSRSITEGGWVRV
ncbi:MAG: Gfo/Idh/MocA family oxidoreductase [Candidatus Latescibacteria bacterium]|nr:Gfo/Idh/MocA family oxidoreductase [Candidatus Latescibacterota bacterium]